MDWLTTIEVIIGVALGLAAALATGLWLFDVQPAPSQPDFDPRSDAS